MGSGSHTNYPSYLLNVKYFFKDSREKSTQSDTYKCSTGNRYLHQKLNFEFVYKIDGHRQFNFKLIDRSFYKLNFSFFI